MEQWNKEGGIAVPAWGLTRSAFCSGPFRVEQALRMWKQYQSVLRLHKRISSYVDQCIADLHLQARLPGS